MIVDYFKQLLESLKQLEDSLFRVDDLERAFHQEILNRINRRALFISMAFLVLVMGYYTLELSGMFGAHIQQTSPVQSFLRMFAASFIIWGLGLFLRNMFRILWVNDYLPAGQKMLRKNLLPKYSKEKKKIEAEAQQVLAQEIINNPQLPAKYLNTKSVAYIVESMQSGEVDDIEHAIGLLEIEAKADQVHKLVIEDKNLLERIDQMFKSELTGNVSTSND